MRGFVFVAVAAAVSGAANAQSSVAIHGLIDLYAARMKSGTGGVKATDLYTNRLDSGGLTTSFIGFRGSEDLGGGLSAGFGLASFLRMDTGQTGRSDAVGAVAADPFFSRESFVYLSDRRLGTVRLGNASTLMWNQSITTNAFGSSTVFSPISTVMFIGSPLTGGTGWTNQIVYDSPSFAGISFNLAAAASEGQNGRNVGGRTTYSVNPLLVSFAYQNVKRNPVAFTDGTSPNNTKSWQLAAGYDFKVVRLWAHLGEIQNDGIETAPIDVKHRIWDLSASVPVGLGNVLIGYARRSTSDRIAPIPITAPAGNKSRQVATVGYDYYLSKRTDIYALAMHDRTESLNTPPPGQIVKASATNFAVGMRHQF